MSFSRSLVLIVPAALKDAANAMGAAAIGWSGDNLSVPLSASGAAPATHYACHAWAQDIAVAWLTGTPIPESMGVPQANVDALLAQITVSADAGLAGGEHFAAAIAAAGLQRIEA